MKDVKDANGQPFKFYDVTGEDFPELEGKIIKYVRSHDELTAMVIGCNRSVGLTIVDATDKDTYLVCLQGPVAPDPTPDEAITYNEVFDMVVQQIMEGEVRAPEVIEAYYGKLHTSTCHGNCAYRQ